MTTEDAAISGRRRVVLMALAAVTVATGLLVHRGVDGPAGDIVGDALYAVLAYLLAASVMPRARRRRPALVAVVFCAGIEFLQLTGLPRAWAEAFPPLGLVFGAGFDPRDLVVYTLAAVAASAVDLALTRALRRPRSAETRARER